MTPGLRRLLHAGVIAGGLVPLAVLVVAAARDALGANPIEALQHATGGWALTFLFASLAVTPLRRLAGWPFLAPYRRTFGLLAFTYASLHLLVYAVLDLFLDWRAIAEDVLERPYVTAGLTAFLCLLPLALTSTRGWQRRLGRRWQKLHRLVYVAALAAVTHYLWLVKADLREPLLWAAALALLLGARVWYRFAGTRSAQPGARSRAGARALRSR